MNRDKLGVTIDWDAASSIALEVMKDDYITILGLLNEAKKWNTDDFAYNLKLKLALEVLFDYYMNETEAAKFIESAKNTEKELYDE